ncbi:GT2 family glycosyltransferase [Terracoccus luteus]|uniref:GT2 family glycosyltransferase n=1 Tax=Terracoccus luteus TaxID=53356 RepID=A0A495XR80_9MICO|nr:glycosyltransferase [Terracoccus luteus]RKT77010.1 GT2 family glycosyltransferase [Terracoccus luteus]
MNDAPDVSVVVPYYERPDHLERLVAGLDAQTLDPSRFELVVADDGSAVPPTVSPRAYAVRVVSQPDLGFRAAAARNLGARSSRGDVVAFVDQDCVPAPEYLERMLAATTGEWSLTVGHRLHAELDGLTGDATLAWLRGAGPAPTVLPEPQWLLDAYARTDGLTRDDPRSYQLVISATLTVHRALLTRIGGFDESLTRYGGEDWDLGHRALVAGADTRWLEEAVVWHDGADLPSRTGWQEAKNRETLALASRVPDRDLRGEHLTWRVPDVVVRLRRGGHDVTDDPDATGTTEDVAVTLAAESLLRGTDARVWLDGPVPEGLEDPRLHEGPVPADVLGRARWIVDADVAVLTGTTLRRIVDSAPLRVPGLWVRSTRDENRSARGVAVQEPATSLPAGVGLAAVPPATVLERWWQSREPS